MYLCTLHSTSQILSVIVVQRKKTEGENAALNAKSCCTICKHCPKWLIMVSCLHRRHQLPPPTEISQHNCASVQLSVFPTLFSQNPTQLTLHRGKTKLSYCYKPGNKLQFQSGFCKYKKALMYHAFCKLALQHLQKQQEPPSMRHSWLPLSCIFMRLYLIPSTSKDEHNIDYHS